MHSLEHTLILLDATPFQRVPARPRSIVEAVRCEVPGHGVLVAIKGSAGIQAALVWPEGVVDFDDGDAAALWEIARHQVAGAMPRAAA